MDLKYANYFKLKENKNQGAISSIISEGLDVHPIEGWQTFSALRTNVLWLRASKDMA